MGPRAGPRLTGAVGPRLSPRQTGLMAPRLGHARAMGPRVGPRLTGSHQLVVPFGADDSVWPAGPAIDNRRV